MRKTEIDPSLKGEPSRKKKALEHDDKTSMASATALSLP
jgi:hypothetical protein